jgi:pyrimidine-nucleoside phosphorylase
MVKIGTMAGKKTAAIVTDMSQPLGNMVGNSLEVIEAIEALNGRGPVDLMEDVYALGSQMLLFAGATKDDVEARIQMKQVIDSKKALDKMAEFVEAQGGNKAQVYDTSLFAVAKDKIPVYAAQDGYICSMDTQSVGIACMTLGGGRETKESQIDLAVGIELLKKTGAKVKAGEVIAYLYANDEQKGKDAKNILENSYHYSLEDTSSPITIKKVITA